ncbi:MAG: hypothetical protein WC708_21340 [Lentisphaeria bacterium]
MLTFCLVACALVLIGLLLGLGLIRLAATLAMILAAVGACGLAVYQITCGYWVGWMEVGLYSLLTGLGTALLCAPLLPFSRFGRNR